MGECGGLELGVGLAEAEALHGFASAAVGAGAIRDLGLLLYPPVRQGRILANEADQLGAGLDHAERAVSGIGGNAEVEGLALPPVEDVRLADPGIGQRQHGAGAGARAAVAGAHLQHAALLVGPQTDHRVPALEAETVAGEGVDPIAL